MELTPGHCCHPHVGQDLRAQVQRKIPDSKSPSYSPGPSNLGNSFQALLHVPASPLECNIHELSNTRSPGVSVRLPVEVSNIALGASGNQVPTLYGGPLSSISQNLHNRMDACAAIGSYSGGNSSYHYGSRASNYFSQGSGMTSVVSHQMFADNADPQAFSSLKRDVPNTISISSSELQEMNHHRSKRSSLMSVPSNCSSSLTSGCPPLVFCMVTSGHLLLSNMGLLGVRCSCHCFRMSVSKFCEHSGLCNVNPGDAVLMDSGETIGQWRKLYFQKFGIRVPEDQSGWDWPDEPHLTASLMKTEAPLPSTFKHSDSNHSIGLPEGLARSGLPGETAVFPKSHLEGKNPVIDVLHFRKQVNNQDSGNFLLKGPIGTWKNQRVSVSEQLTMTKTTDRDLKNACQSMLNDVIKKTGSFSSTQPNMQNLGPLMRSNHISRAKNEKVVPLERDSGGSSMELRLGQPYQQVQCSGGPCLSIMVPHLNNKAVHPKKLCPQQQIMNNVSTQKGFVAGASDSSRRTKYEKHATGNCIVIGNLDKVEVSKNSLAPLFTHLSSPAEGSSAIKATTQIINTAEHIPPLAQDHVAVRSKQGLVSASWTNTNNLENRCTHHEFGVFIPANNHMKEMHASGSSFSVAGSGSKVQVQENHCSFSGGASLNNAFCLPAAHDKNHSHHIARVPPDTSDPGKFSNYFRKIPCFSSNRHANHVLLATSGSCKDPIQVLPVESLPMGYPLSTSTSNSGLTPVMLKQDMSSNLLTDNRQSRAVRQILPLSNQQHQMSSVSENLDQRNSTDSYNLKRRKFVNELPLFGESNVPDLTRETDVAELTVQSSTCYKLSNATDFASRSGLTDGCTSSKLIHGIPHSSMEIEMRSRISHISLGFERALPRHGSCQKTNSVTEHGVFCSTALNHQENDNCKCQTKGHGGRYEFIVDNPSNSSTEETETIYNKGHNLTTISSQFIEDHRAAKGTDISSTELGNITGKQPRNFTCLASQWKDVPSKKKRIDNVVSVKQAVDKSINLGTRWDKSCQLEDTFANCSNVAVLVKDSFEEQEISDISSGCSAPAATTVSTEVNNVVSSTVAHGMENENTLPYDEGSGIDKCCSSYDALDDDKTFEFNGSTCKSNLRKGSDEAINESPRSLLEEIKLLNSLAWKRGRNQITSGNLCAKTNHLQQCEGLKIRKRKSDEITVMPDASFGTTVCAICNTGQETSHVSGACSMKNSSLDGKYTSSIATKPSRKRDLTMFYTEGLIEIDQKINLEGNTNCSRNPLNSSRKKGKRTRSSDGSTQALSEKAGYCGPGSLGKVNKSQTVNLCITKPRPVVCGKFGEICSSGVNFDVSFRKPAKLVSLDKILKNTKRCALPKYCETDLILPSCGRSYTCSNKHSNFVDNKEKGESDTSVSHKIDLLTSTKDRKTMSYSLDNESVCKTLPQEREKDDKRSHAQSKPKEVRERSLYELTFKGNSCTAMLSHKLFDIARKAEKAVKFPKGLLSGSHRGGSTRNIQDRQHWCHKDSDTFCCVCGRLNEDEMNCLLECGSCSIRVHQTCYGVPKAPKGHWYCRPCKTNSKDIVCVLCGYGGGAMTQALRTQTIVKSLLKAWNFGSECGDTTVSSAKASHDELSLLLSSGSELEDYHPCAALGNGPLTSIASNAKIMRKGIDNIEGHLMFQGNLKRHNSIVAGVTDSTVKQWIHMVCGLWTPGTRCPNVYTMSAFDVSGVSLPRANVVCSICNRPGGSCIRCRAANCTIRFHPWCAQKKGLLQSEAEGVDNENIGFYGSCLLHATCSTNEDACDFPNMDTNCQQKEFSCSRTEGYKGRKKDGFWYDKIGCQSERKRGFVPQEQLNAWIHINQQKSSVLRMSELPTSDVETDCRKEYARYKQTGGWRHLVVYKSGIHALGLYTSRFISRGEMVVEYVGEIIGSRVADKRENDYQLGRKLQYKSACYFFRIDKEHIIDATRKGGIARFVNHSCLPNCVAKVIQMRNEKKVVFFAERDIYPGEEITYDYHFNHEDDGEKIPCFCNAKNCRRYLN